MAPGDNFKFLYLKLLLTMYFKFKPSTAFPYTTILERRSQLVCTDS